MKPQAAGGLAAALAVCLACGAGDPGETLDEGAARGPSPSLTVSAAASLTDAFQEIADTFEARHPGTTVTLNLAGSSALATQIQEGAPVDVFAPADSVHLTEVAAALDGPGRVFATNRLQIAVPQGNPGGVKGLADLGREELVVGLCAPSVPCGRLARQALERAGVSPRPDTEEPNARALLTKVRLGEVDVALVYRSDVEAGGAELEGIPLPDRWNVQARYPIAVVTGGPALEAAREFAEFVLSAEGARILAGHGLGRPQGPTS